MDQKTKAALKQDKFIDTTSHGLEWASANRRSVITTSIILLVVIVALVLGGVMFNNRSNDANAALGTAMQTYQTPIAQADEPTPPGVETFPSLDARAKAAGVQFADVANKYGMTTSGKMARYFLGLTQIDTGQTQQAEETLKKVADSWDGNLAALAKFALAQLYRDSGRNDQAISLYNELTQKPTTTVPAGEAQLQLAALYQADGDTQKSKDVLAALKQKDPKGTAGALAAEKLNPAPVGEPALPAQ